MRHPLSRSYGAILPSSLTMLLPPALGFSPHPPVSVYGTGPQYTIAAFLGSGCSGFPTLTFGPRHTRIPDGGFSSHPSLYLYRAFLSRLRPGHCVTTVLVLRGTGISTCCPSATPPGLALGPDLPRADQLYPGNLRYSAVRILTLLSLLIPAFSLLQTPPLLTVRLRRLQNAPLPMYIHTFRGFGGVFQPRTFSAQDLSASELLRTLLMDGCF